MGYRHGIVELQQLTDDCKCVVFRTPPSSQNGSACALSDLVPRVLYLVGNQAQTEVADNKPTKEKTDQATGRRVLV